MTNNKTMTKGKISPALYGFTLPLLVSALFQQLYNMADSVIAGQCQSNGESAVAAIGASFGITMIFMSVAFGCNAGCSVVIGRLFGARRYKKIKTAVGTTLIAFLSFALLLTAVGRLVSRPLLALLNTPQSIMADAETYLNVYVYGLTFLFLYNACTGIFTALGDSKTPLYFLIASSLLNVALDYVFVAFCGWGVAGVAWATFITQALAALMSLFVMTKRLRHLEILSIVNEEPFEKGQNYPVFSFKMLQSIMIIALPSIVQQGVISVGNFMVQGVVNHFGKAVIAGFAVGVKLRTFAMAIFISGSNALATFSAQNMGADNPQRVKKGFLYSALFTWCVILPFVVLYVFFGEFMIRLFVKDISAAALNAGMTYLKIVAPFFFIISIKSNSDAVLKGSAKMVQFMISTMLDLFLCVGFAYLLGYSLNTELGIWWSWPIGWVIATCVSFGFYLSGIWYKPTKHKSIAQKAMEKV